MQLRLIHRNERRLGKHPDALTTHVRLQKHARTQAGTLELHAAHSCFTASIYPVSFIFNIIIILSYTTNPCLTICYCTSYLAWW